MKENNTWRIRYNNELYKQCDEPGLSDIINLKRLQWAGHVQRMEGKGIPKRILENNFIGKRPVGKTRKRWINAVETDSREILKVRNWKRESLDRQVWRRYLKEAKARLRAVAP
jgi:aldehyde:ferredoxin oxidoreductase